MQEVLRAVKYSLPQGQQQTPSYAVLPKSVPQHIQKRRSKAKKADPAQ